jgi:hypothetical protein
MPYSPNGSNRSRWAGHIARLKNVRNTHLEYFGRKILREKRNSIKDCKILDQLSGCQLTTLSVSRRYDVDDRVISGY